jgi:hypothetical protein
MKIISVMRMERLIKVMRNMKILRRFTQEGVEMYICTVLCTQSVIAIDEIIMRMVSKLGEVQVIRFVREFRKSER